MIGRRQAVRLTLTLWYSGALVIVLAVYAAVVFTAFEHDLWQQLDVLLHEDIEHITTELQGGEANPLAEDDEWAEVWSEGRVLYQSPLASRRPLASLAAPSTSSRVTVAAPGGRGFLRVRDERQRIGNMDAYVRVAEPEDQVRHQVSELLWLMGLGVPVAVVIAGFGGYHLARRALSPVNEIAARAKAISADRLSERLPISNPDDEVGRLAVVINDLLGRLEQSFSQMRRFTADASHELRTPLTAIRTVGEVGLRSDKGEAGARETVASMLEEVERLTQLVDAMLMLSRADAGRIPVNRIACDMAALVDEVATQLGVLAEEKHQTIVVTKTGEVRASVDPVILRMAIVNLVDNAIRYSPEGGTIAIDVRFSGSSAEVAVRDSGPGIAPTHQQRLFERFYRVDDGRSRRSGGTGLGLAIARWAVEAHDGRLEVVSRPGSGSTFRIVLPAV